MSEWDQGTHLATCAVKNVEMGIKHLENRQRAPDLMNAKQLNAEIDVRISKQNTQRER